MGDGHYSQTERRQNFGMRVHVSYGIGSLHVLEYYSKMPQHT